MLRALTAASVLLAATLCGAATIVVDAGGGGDKVRIQQAINSASVGDDIVVRPGLYDEALIVDKALVIRGSDPAQCRLVNSGSGDALTFTSASQNARVIRLSITSLGGNGVLIQDGATPTLKNCIILGSANNGVYVLTQSQTLGPVISNCVVSSNSNYGIYYSAYPHSLSNTIVISNETGIAWRKVPSNNTNKFPNCFGYLDVWGNVLLQYNYYEYSWKALTDIPLSSISSDPAFVGQTGGDYRLRSSSPCIDAGWNSSVYADLDGTRNDMGAYGGPEAPVPVPTTFSASGAVTLSGESTHSGVTLTFARVSGTGEIPAAVQTASTGAWSATGFAVGTVYTVTPALSGWQFTPTSSQFGDGSSTLTFTGQRLSFAVSGTVTLSGQSDHSGVSVAFTRVSGTGAIPPAVTTTSTGAWSATGFAAGTVYLATPTRAGWSFAPVSAQLSSPSTAVSFSGTQPPFAASGQVTLGGQSDHSGVTVTFTRVSGSGSIPGTVQTTTTGTWSRAGFVPGTVYLATPSRAGWIFTPPFALITTAATALDFGGQQPPFSVSGTVTLEGQSDHSGVTVTFTRVSGAGVLPAAVQTASTGAWSASGFELGTVYEATASRPGWGFTPASAQFSAPTTALVFDGEMPSAALLVRAILGNSRLVSPAQVAVGRRVQIEVLVYTLKDKRDSTAVAAFTVDVPASLGAASGANAARLVTLAGVTDALTVSAAGLTQEFVITTVPGSIDHLVIQPDQVAVAPGQQVDFDARGVDSYGNEFALAGVSLGWYCHPPALGSITQAGLFTAGAEAAEGAVIAVVSRSLRFGGTSVSDGATGRIVVRRAQPALFALHPTAPNPFNPETTIRFDLAEPRPVRLEVYDSSGRMVRMLVNQTMQAGSHLVAWDGTDARGAAVASGVYLVRLAAGEFVSVRKAALLR